MEHDERRRGTRLSEPHRGFFRAWHFNHSPSLSFLHNGGCFLSFSNDSVYLVAPPFLSHTGSGQTVTRVFFSWFSPWSLPPHTFNHNEGDVILQHGTNCCFASPRRPLLFMVIL